MAKKKKHRVKIIVGAIILIVAAAALWAVFGKKNDDAIAVSAEKVQKRDITQTVGAIGKIQPEIEVKISSEASGEIILLNVQEGDAVKSGQLLVRIQPDLIETQVEQFEASAESAKVAIEAVKSERERAKNDLERIVKLFQKEFASKEEFDRAKTAYDQADSRYQQTLRDYDRALSALKQIKTQSTRTTIFSPISGTVAKLNVERGEKVVGTAQMQGTEMMRVADLTVMNAVVDVDENDIVFVKIGDTAQISVDALPNETIRGIVYEIAHSAKTSNTGTQEETTNFEVKIRILDNDQRFRPGMSCNVEIATETHRNVLAVPLQAVTMRETPKDENEEKPERLNEDKQEKSKKKQPDNLVVFLEMKDNTVKMRKVKTGLSDRGFIEIVSGLKEGESVVSGNFQAVNKLLNDGSKISRQSKEKKFFK